MLSSFIVLSGAVSAAFATTTITAAPQPSAEVNALALDKRAPSTALPLTSYKFPYSQIPYKVNPFPPATPDGRGPQTGYNQCNSTTEGSNSMCQTLIVNSLADFCIWGSPEPNGITGNIEGETVAFCMQPGHGARTIRPGALTGAQFIRTDAYIQITGRLDQTGINLKSDDMGGELDPHGADLLGNPLGALVYSNSIAAGGNNTLTQAYSWTNFLGSNEFCIKVCFNNVTSPNYCENRYDIIGCGYNMPASYKDNEFTVCDGERQQVVGTYVQNGQTLTWDQNSGGDPPYTPVIPRTSNCQTFSSAALYPTGSSSSASASASVTGTPSVSGSGLTTSRSTGTGTAPTSTPSGGAATIGASAFLLFISAAGLFSQL